MSPRQIQGRMIAAERSIAASAKRFFCGAGLKHRAKKETSQPVKAKTRLESLKVTARENRSMAMRRESGAAGEGGGGGRGVVARESFRGAGPMGAGRKRNVRYQALAETFLFSV